jgi:hypothetical protein
LHKTGIRMNTGAGRLVIAKKIPYLVNGDR